MRAVTETLMHKVLVVETDPTLREWLRLHLLTHGVAATALDDGRRALEAVRVEQPDLLIVSTDLPRNGAFALAAAMRSNVQTAPVPMLFLVSPNDAEALAQCMSIEPEGVITKPLSRNVLLEAVAARLSAAKHQPGLVQRSPALEPFLPAPSVGAHTAVPSGLLVEVKDATVLIVVVRNLVSLARAFNAKTLDALLSQFVGAAREAVLERAGRTLRADATGLTAHFEDGPGESRAHAARGIEAALAVAVAARRVKHWAEKHLTGSPGPELSVGCGVHTGEIILARLSLSGSVPPCMAGQTADVATRLDGRAKGLGWSVAASQTCAQVAGSRFQIGRQASLNDTDHGVIIPIAEIIGLNPGAAKPGELGFMAEVREAVLANTMLAALAGDADQRVTERTMVVSARRQARDDVLPELPDRRIERQVRRAASASVYLGVHLPTDRRERLVCLQGAEHHEIFIERYLEQYRQLARIEQRNVLGIYEVGRHKGLAYVATEVLNGETLGEAMRRKLPIGLALNCLAQMCIALDALHDVGIVHGSLQADDFAFRDDRVLVLAEFNVNDRVRAALGMDSAGFERRDRDFDNAGRDLHALGRILYEMLVGIALSTVPNSQQASTPELFRATRLPLSLSPVQPCLDRLLGVGSTAPIERAEDVLVELLSLKELFPFDTALRQLEPNTGLRKIGP
jgi:DNA-binding response OmpR family regulator